MRLTKRFRLVACLAILPALPTLPSLAAAQSRSLGVLQGSPWPRAAALGDIGAATALPEGFFYNPALAGAAAGIAGSAHRFGSDSLLTTAVAGLTTAVGSLGVGVQMLRARLGGNPLGERLPDASLPDAFGLTTASSVGGSLRFKGIRWGAALKYLQIVERGEHDAGAAIDVGAQRPIGPISVGIAALNLGSDMRIDGAAVDLPRRITIAAEGVGLPRGAFIDLAAAAAVTVDRDGEVLPAAAGQIIYTPLDGLTFALRAGLRRTAPASNQRPFTGGVGFTLDRLTIDYAVEDLVIGHTVHRLGARLR